MVKFIDRRDSDETISMSGEISHRPSTPFKSLKSGCNFPFSMGIMAKASRNPTADALAVGKLIGLSRFRCLGRFRLADKTARYIIGRHTRTVYLEALARLTGPKRRTES